MTTSWQVGTFIVAMLFLHAVLVTVLIALAPAGIG